MSCSVLFLVPSVSCLWLGKVLMVLFASRKEPFVKTSVRQLLHGFGWSWPCLWHRLRSVGSENYVIRVKLCLLLHGLGSSVRLVSELCHRRGRTCRQISRLTKPREPTKPNTGNSTIDGLTRPMGPQHEKREHTLLTDRRPVRKKPFSEPVRKNTFRMHRIASPSLHTSPTD